jgi:hypothetical protein
MNKYLSLSIACGCVLLLSFAACSLTEVEPERIIYPGEIRHEMAPPHENARVDIAGHTVSGPDAFLRTAGVELYDGIVEVQAGVPFNVTVHTFAAIKCHQVEPSEVEIEAKKATISVFDSWPGPPHDPPPCHAVLILLPRTDTIVFTEPGEAEVVIRGDKIGGGRHPFELRLPVLVKE